MLKRYRLVLLVAVVWWSAFFGNRISAEEFNLSADNIDVMFILDTSYSMTETDKDRISMEMLKLFTDISYSSRTRIGFVAYSDSIGAFIPLTEISGDKEKEDFKKSFDSIKRIGRTDTGLGLKKGWELLDSDPKRQSLIILLTDGEIDIDPASHPPGKPRTNADSKSDVYYVVEQAAAKHVPIFTVALGRNGVDLALLDDIARRTGAVRYIADTPQALLDVFNNIFVTNFTSRIVPIADVTANGKTQEVDIKIPDRYAAEANVIFLSSSALKETQVFYGSKQMGFYNSRNYSSVKIVRPDQQEVKIRFKGAPNDVVKVSMLLHYDFKGELEVNGQPESGQPVTLRAYFKDKKTGSPIVDKNLYNVIASTAVIQNLVTGEEIKISAKATDKGWEVKHAFPGKGQYLFSVQTDNNYFRGASRLIVVSDFIPTEPPKKNSMVLAIAAMLSVVVMAVMIYYRNKLPKYSFAGKIDVYYLKPKHPGKAEVPPITIMLQDFSDLTKTNLYEMLQTVNADQGLTEGEKIWFRPGIDNTIVLSHMSSNTVLVGHTVICKNQNYVLHYGDILYIAFSDDNTEIEVHYNAVKLSKELFLTRSDAQAT